MPKLTTLDIIRAMVFQTKGEHSGQNNIVQDGTWSKMEFHGLLREETFFAQHSK